MQLRRYRFRRGLVRARRVIAVSEATRRDVQNLMGVPPERIRRVYNAPDPRLLRARRATAPEEHQRILERYQIQYPFPALRRQRPPAQEHSAPGGSVRRGARATGATIRYTAICAWSSSATPFRSIPPCARR